MFKGQAPTQIFYKERKV